MGIYDYKEAMRKDILGTLGFWAVYGEGVDRTNYRNATPLYGVTRRTFEKETGGEV